MAGEELTRAHRTLALGLNVRHAKASGTGRDDQAIAVGFDDRSRLQAAVAGSVDEGAEQDEPFGSQKTEGMRPWMQAANQVVNAGRRPLPVDGAIVLREPVRVGRETIVLRRLAHLATGDLVHDRDEQTRANRCEVAFDLLAGFFRPDRTVILCQHRPGVECLDHSHDRDSRRDLAVDDGPMNRGRTAVSGKQRSVDVDHAEPGDGQDCISQDATVRRDDTEIGLPRGQRVEKHGVLHALRLKDRQSRLECPRLDRRVGGLLTAAARPIRLRDDAGDGVRRGGEQRVE